jgi:replicative DNA helicase
VVALAQLNRNADGRRPTIADIRDSGNIEQDADLILLLHRESDQPEDATLIIGKNRHGATRDIPMIWKHQWTRYLETKLAK